MRQLAIIAIVLALSAAPTPLTQPRPTALETALAPAIARSLARAITLELTPAWGGEVNELEALRKRVKELEVETLKLRFNLVNEKLVNQKFEFNLLVTERGRICNEISAADPKAFQERCTENK